MIHNNKSRLIGRWSESGGYRALLTMAFPLILSTGASSVLHFIDRMFLTWYSPETIAAAMPGGILNFTVMSFFIGTAGYVNTFVAQYQGAKRFDRIGSSLWQGLYIAIAGGTIVLIISFYSKEIFDFVGHPEKVRAYETSYFMILSRFAVFPIAASAFGGFFSGRGRNWPVMWANIVALIVNVALDYVMIFGKFGFTEQGIAGAAKATVIAGAGVCLFYVVLIFTSTNQRKYRVITGAKIDLELLGRMLKYGAPSGVQFFIDMSGFSVFILLIGRLGMTELAASNVAFNINTLAFLPMVGLGIAISVMVGQYQGEGNSKQAERSVYSGAHICFVYMTLIAVTYIAFPGIYLSAFSAQADAASFEPIRRLAVIILRFVAIYTVFDTLNIVFASALKGAGDTRFVMFMIVILAVAGLMLPTYIAITVFGANIYGAWLVVSIYISLLGFSFLARFLSGKWKSMKVIESVDVSVSVSYPAVPTPESEV